MMNRRLTLSLLALLAAYSQAQENNYRYADATQAWRLTNNAAALGLDSTENRGYALFNAEHQSGDYKRVQEGLPTNQLRFKTERYQTIGKYLHGYGRFDFDYGREKNRAWCDVMRPYDANPYMAGSAIKGKYDFQDFDFTAALGTVDLNNWRYGLRLDYKVGDLSRLRDPRSRSQLLDYKLSPAVIRTMGRHVFGLSASYQRRKEKITGVTTVQQDPTLKYYLMTGMEHADGTTGGYSSFVREWVDHTFAAEISYGYRHADGHSVVAASIARDNEYVYGQYKYEPGRFTGFTYALDAHHRSKEGRLLHQLDLHVSYRQAYADEYRQKLQQEKDAKTGFTSFYYTNLMTFKKRYQVNCFEANMRYRAHLTSQKDEKAYFGASISLNDNENKYLLPTSRLSHGGTLLLTEGGTAIGKRLWIDAEAGGFLSQEAALSLSDMNTDYAQQVLLPDMNYYRANYWTGKVAVSYQFPLTLKGQTSWWFVRAYGSYVRANGQMDSRCIGLSIGLYN